MCGIFGVYGKENAVWIIYQGLYALQHRGEEAVGIAFSNKKYIECYKKTGLVVEAFENIESLKSQKTYIAIGHVRYSTTGQGTLTNAQPLLARYKGGQIAIAHNGNLTNASEIRKKLIKKGAIFQTSVDSEVILNLIALSAHADILFALKEALSQLKGAYSLLLLTTDRLIAVRDTFGFRPLCIGKFEDESLVVASESCALDLVRAKFIREIECGEIVEIKDNKLNSYFIWNIAQREIFRQKKQAKCVFEFIYFAKPDSIIFNQSVYEVRVNLGRALAEQDYIKADVVVPVPDSGVCAALGYAETSKIPYKLGLIRNHYVGRTFIKPHQPLREIGVMLKLNPVKEVIRGRKVILVDDSIVRGTTCKKIINMIKEAGAKEIHLRISSPPIKFPCLYGIDTPTKQELIAANLSIDKIKEFLGVDTLIYLQYDNLKKIVGGGGFCYACFDGNYPIL